MNAPLAQERVWFQKAKYDEAEKNYYERLTGCAQPLASKKSENAKTVHSGKGNTEKTDKCKQPQVHDQKQFDKEPTKDVCIKPATCVENITGEIDDIAAIASTNTSDLTNRINTLEKEKSSLKQQLNDLTTLVKKLEARITNLEKSEGSKVQIQSTSSKPAPPKPTPASTNDDDEDDGVDLFGSDSEEDAEALKVKEQRLAEYAAKKSKKPALIAKSNIILDVKPWDDETDMKKMEEMVRKIETDGLVWGASKLVPLAYGIHKLQISCVVEDDKVSVDWLQETIEEIEEFVQSVDIAAFNKV